MSIRKTVIQSTSNARLLSIKKDRQLLFFEGQKLSMDILAEKENEVELLIVLHEQFDALQIAHHQQVNEIWLVSPQVMAKLSDMKSIPPIIAVIRYRPQKIDFKRSNALLALNEVQDPGNVGTLLRTACAFGFDGVAQIGPSVNLSNRKLIRSAQNALLKIPVQQFLTFSDFITKCRKHRLAVYLSSADPRQGPLGPEEMIPPCAIVLGNEGTGFDKDILTQHPSVRIPQNEAIDSLNVSISGSILMHELRKKWGYE